MKKPEVKRGDVFFAHLSPVQGSEQGGCRPVLVVQNDVGNTYSPTTIVLAITSQIEKAKLPTHIELRPAESGLDLSSVILAEQIRTIDKSRLRQKLTTLNSSTMNRVSRAMSISVGL
jgi:mRNA interferase MazF